LEVREGAREPGTAFLVAADCTGLEGIVSKKANMPYRSGKVLDALVESAARLCEAYDAATFQVFGDGLRLVAHHGQIPMGGPIGQYTLPLARELITGRVVIDRRDDGLVGKGIDELDLAFGERANFGATDYDCTNRLARVDQRGAERAVR
jgi:hypothetical protein